MYFLQMMLAFLILFGVVLFLRKLLRVNTGEGMMLAASVIALLFVLSSKLGTFAYGYYAICILGIIGIGVGAIRIVQNGKTELKKIVSPVLVALVLLYLFWLIFLYHDFIQHIDELHHWAAGVKYMVNKDAMPGNDFVAGGGHYAWATTLFHLFFQKFTGYNEQSMYVSASVLMWIGFLMPFSGHEWKNWKKVVLYVGIVYIALYTLYLYGPKSLYVDVPTAAWAGGLAAWWTKREKKKADYLIAASGLLMLHYFKASAGLLMAVFVLLFMVGHTFLVDRKHIYKEGMLKKISIGTGILCVLVIMGSVAVLGLVVNIRPYENETEHSVDENVGMQQWELAGVKLPDRISQQINFVKLSKEKAMKTLGAFLTNVFGSALASRSKWDMPFIPFIVLVLILLKVCGDLYGQQKKSKFLILYAVFTTLSYSAAVYFSYLFMFAYELSINLRSAGRYFSICSIYLFILALSELLQNEAAEKEKIREYVSLGVLAFFAMGLNTSFIPNATAINKEKISGFDKINETSIQVSKLQSILEKDDRVYYLCQQPADDLGDAELYNCTALYYLEEQISNYLMEPWKFTSTGCNIRLEEYNTSIVDFPALLAQGGYTYVWVHTTNQYLTRELPIVLPCDKEVNDGYLYEVVYENGMPIYLEFVQDLDNM